MECNCLAATGVPLGQFRFDLLKKFGQATRFDGDKLRLLVLTNLLVKPGDIPTSAMRWRANGSLDEIDVALVSQHSTFLEDHYKLDHWFDRWPDHWLTHL